MMGKGNSLRAITRLRGTSRTTLIKPLEDAGQASSEYQDQTLMNLKCKRLQFEKARSFCYAKQKICRPARPAPEVLAAIFGRGLGVTPKASSPCRSTLAVCDIEAAMIFMDDLAKQLVNRLQLTSGGFTVLIWKRWKERSAPISTTR